MSRSLRLSGVAALGKPNSMLFAYVVGGETTGVSIVTGLVVNS